MSWNTANATAVQITGPGGFASSQPSGSEPVCPGTPFGPDCTAPAGAYTYTVRATDASGAVVFERSVTFTVG